jgi:hypothetical protein
VWGEDISSSFGNIITKKDRKLQRKTEDVKPKAKFLQNLVADIAGRAASATMCSTATN